MFSDEDIENEFCAVAKCRFDYRWLARARKFHGYSIRREPVKNESYRRRQLLIRRLLKQRKLPTRHELLWWPMKRGRMVDEVFAALAQAEWTQ